MVGVPGHEGVVDVMGRGTHRSGGWERSSRRSHRLRQRLTAVGATLGLALGLGGVTALPAGARAACADLRVSAFSVSPAQPVTGQVVVITADITNAGTCAAGSFVTQLQSLMDPRDWQSRTTSALAPGATTTVQMGVDFPGPGAYQPAVVVDLNSQVAETNETNNRQVVPVTVRPATVELVVTGVSINPVRPVRGKPMTLVATVRNVGAGTTQSFGVTWQPAWNTDLFQKRVAGLAAGASATISWTFTYRSYWNFDSVVTVDSSGEVPEVDERNNDFRFQVPVEPARPDLVVQGMHLSPSNPLPGQDVTAEFVIKNVGNTAATTKFWLSWLPTPEWSTNLFQFPGLAVGATATVRFTMNFPTTGVFLGEAIVDPYQAVPEIDEANNTMPVIVPVAPNRINLKVVSQVRTSTPTQDQPTAVDVTVTNTGNTASGPFTLDWNPDVAGLLGAGDRTQRRALDSLARGEKTVVTFSYVYPRPGAFSARATADADDRVVELTSTDNTSTLPVTVASPAADLTVTRFSLGSKRPVSASVTTAAITVTNAGTAAAGPFDVQWRIPGSGTVRSRVDGLAVGQSRTLVMAGVVGSKGKARSTVVVAVDDQVTESRRGERNNTTSRPVSVAAASR
jgi:subtilase family serine protease